MEMTGRSQRFCCPYLSKNLQGKDKRRTKAWLASPVMPKHPHGLTPAAWLQTGLQACGAPSQQLRLPAGAPGLCHAREMPRAGLPHRVYQCRFRVGGTSDCAYVCWV